MYVILKKLGSFLDWITRKDDNEKMGNGIDIALILSFGIISIFSSIVILYSALFAAGNGLVLMDLLSRIVLAGFFLVIGIGLLFYLRTRNSQNDEDDFWQTLKDTYVCMPREKNLIYSDTIQEKHLFGIGAMVEKEQT